VAVHAPAYSVPLAATLLIVFAPGGRRLCRRERLGIDTLSVGMHNLWLAARARTSRRSSRRC
jgi:hypothetical protein